MIHRFTLIFIFLFLSLLTVACTHLAEKKVVNEMPVKPLTVVSKIDLDGQIKATKFIFENGLRLIVYENRRLPVFTYLTFFDVGGRFEKAGQTGATHFLEHMMFKGSVHYPQGIFDSTIEKSGGRTNAYTTFDSTVYDNHIPSTLLKEMITLEADRMRGPIFSEESFESERKVILEERKMRYENRPEGKLYLKTMQEFFKKTPYGLSVIGSNEDLRALTRENVERFFKTFYTPDNATIVIAGDVETDEVRELVAAAYADQKSSMARGTPLTKLKGELDHDKFFKRENSKKHNVTRLKGLNGNPLFMIAYNGYPVGSRDSAKHDLLGAILSQGESAYLLQKLVKISKPTLSEISAGNHNLKKNGTLIVNGTLAQNVPVKGFEALITKELKASCSVAITDLTLQKVKNQVKVSMYDTIRTNDGVGALLGNSENFFGDFRKYDQELKDYESITTAELKDECLKVFNGGMQFTILAK